MWERIKTGILSVLVGISLIFTYTIWTSVPMNTPTDRPTVLSNVSYGPEKSVNDLVYPDRVVAHFGNSKHTILYPGSEGYTMLLKELQKASIYDMKSVSFGNSDWKTIISGRGLELHFSWNIPFSVINQLFPGIKLIEPKPSCETIYIQFDSTLQNNRIVFVSKSSVEEAYEARLGVPMDAFVDLLHDLETKQPQYVLFGNTASQSYYLPKDSLQLPVYRFRLDSFNVEQLTNSFFVDPSLTKKINERDGSFIKTDGSRGVRFSPDINRVQYTDPASDLKDDPVIEMKQINKAITFSNDHGGIVGEAQLIMSSPYLYGPGTTYVIQNVVHGLPVLGDMEQVIIRMQGNEVVEFDRAIQYRGEQVSTVTKPILSASRLMDVLAKAPSINIPSITQITLAYHPNFLDKRLVELEPVFRIEQPGVTRVVDAITGDVVERGNKNGLE
jgi:regulatory protein YycH of two-component signal transduction system YycFG